MSRVSCPVPVRRPVFVCVAGDVVVVGGGGGPVSSLKGGS